MWLSMGILSVTLGAIISLNNILQRKINNEGFDKRILYVGGGLAGFVVLIMILGPNVFDFNGAYDEQLRSNGFPVDKIIEDRKAYAALGGVPRFLPGSTSVSCLTQGYCLAISSV